jgi:hypothetical protein
MTHWSTPEYLRGKNLSSKMLRRPGRGTSGAKPWATLIGLPSGLSQRVR